MTNLINFQTSLKEYAKTQTIEVKKDGFLTINGKETFIKEV